MKRVVVRVLVALVALVPVFVLPPRADAQDEPAVQAESVIDGLRADISEGTVVTQATPTDDGCYLPERVGIGAIVAESALVDSVSIDTKFDDACRLIVTDVQTKASADAAAVPVEVESGSLPPETPPAAPGITILDTGTPATNVAYVPDTKAYKVQVYKGWTKSRMEEYVNIDTTQAYHEFHYFLYRDAPNSGGYRVDRPHADDGWCWMDSDFLWVNDKCTYATYDQSPGQVWFETWAHFHSASPPRPDYTQYSTYFAQPSFFNFDCYLSQGVQPAGWGFNCEGGRKLTATWYPNGL